MNKVPAYETSLHRCYLCRLEAAGDTQVNALAKGGEQDLVSDSAPLHVNLLHRQRPFRGFDRDATRIHHVHLPSLRQGLANPGGHRGQEGPATVEERWG